MNEGGNGETDDGCLETRPGILLGDWSYQCETRLNGEGDIMATQQYFNDETFTQIGSYEHHALPHAPLIFPQSTLIIRQKNDQEERRAEL